MLCSDGVSNQITDDELRHILTKSAPREACETMIALANERGGEDNETVIVADVARRGPRRGRRVRDRDVDVRGPAGVRSPSRIKQRRRTACRRGAPITEPSPPRSRRRRMEAAPAAEPASEPTRRRRRPRSSMPAAERPSRSAAAAQSLEDRSTEALAEHAIVDEARRADERGDRHHDAAGRRSPSA